MTIKSSAVCLREVETEKVENKKGISNDGNISPENILYMLSPPHSFCLCTPVSPFACEGGVARGRLGRHVVVRVRTVEEGLSSLALGKGGVQGEAWTLRAQRGVTW